MVGGGARGLHSDALLQTLSLFLLEKHLGDVLPQPLIGHVHAQLECTQHTNWDVNLHLGAHGMQFLLRDLLLYVCFKKTQMHSYGLKTTCCGTNREVNGA